MRIKNVSFIVIALNEEYPVSKCLSSINKMKLSNCEVICIDSNSSDNTLEIMLSFKDKIENLIIYKIYGDVNAAIARNVGIKSANRKFIFFVDGDIELEQEFICLALKKIEKENYMAVTGDLSEIHYSSGYKSVLKKIESRCCLSKEKDIHFSGGNFIAKKEAIDNIGFFNENLKKNQDRDFTLRLSSKYKMVAIPNRLGIHHTIPYYDNNRIKVSIINQHGIYVGRTLRNNINNLRGVGSVIAAETGISYGLLFYLLLCLSILLFNKILMTLVPVMFIADIVYGIKQKKSIYHRIVSHYIHPIFVIKGFFYLTDKNHYSVEKVYSD